MDFFERVIELQKPFATKEDDHEFPPDQRDPAHGQVVRLSEEARIPGRDQPGRTEGGPRPVSPRPAGNGTFDRVMGGLKLLQKHEVEYNVLACVARETAKRPLDVYRFLRSEGVEFMQFTPIVERLAGAESGGSGLRLSGPPALNREELAEVSAWSVEPERYGDFLIAVYEEWVRNDVGKIFVMNFEWALNAWIGNPSPVCVHSVQCGSVARAGAQRRCLCLRSLCLPAVPPRQHRERPVDGHGGAFAGIGLRCRLRKRHCPAWCRECDVLPACRGGCPKHRFMKTYSGSPDCITFARDTKNSFVHIRKYLKAMTQLLENGHPASLVMEALKGPLVIKQENRGTDRQGPPHSV